MKTFTTYAEKKAKQFLNLLQGYTKGIRLTAILILLLMGVSNAWGYDVYLYTGSFTNWEKDNAGFRMWDGSSNQNFTKIGEHWYRCSTSKTGTMYIKRGDAAHTQDYSGNEFSANISSTDNVVKVTDWGSGALTSLHITGNDWGGIGSWVNNNDGGKMAITSGTTFTKTFTDIPNSAHEFKITFWGTWDNAIGYSTNVSCVNGKLEDNGGNIKFTPYVTGNVTITYDVETGKTVITCTAPTITFDKEGGSGGTQTQEAPYGTATSAITVPTKTGYTFGGYYSGDNGTGTQIIGTDGKWIKSKTDFTDADNKWIVTSNKTLYAKWTASTYTITYKDQGGGVFSGTHATGYPTTHTYGTATTLKTASKTGYTFEGWHTDAACTKKVTSLGATAYTANITLYAKWTAKQYTITYKDQGNVAFSGTHASGYPTTHTYGTATTLKTASKKGYTFVGWHTDAACTNKVTSLGATAYTADITLYAKWTANQYTINYKDQGNVAFSGTHASGYPTTHTYGTTTTLKTATKAGYTFDGWFTNSSCTGSAVTSLGATDYTANITLYAKWSEIAEDKYNVTAVADPASGGVVTPATATPMGVTSGGKITATANEGYEFTKWSLKSGHGYFGETGTYNTSTTANTIFRPTQVSTIKATFTEIQRTITVTSTNALYGTVSPTSVTAGVVTQSVEITATPKEGYKFNGWSVTKGSGNITLSSTSNLTITVKKALSDGTITADFKEKTNTVLISYKCGNTSIQSDATQSIGEAKATSITAPEHTGYTFTGWTLGTGITNHSANTTANPISITTNSTGSGYTLTANYTKNSYTLNFGVQGNIGGSATATVDGNAITSPETFEHGTKITLTATADDKYAFIQWVDGSGASLSTANPYTHTLTATTTIQAVFANTDVLYLKPIDDWKQNNEWYAAYFYKEGTGDNFWVRMKNEDPCGGSAYYKTLIPDGDWTHVIFIRMDGSKTDLKWENKWDQTVDLTIPTDGKNCFTNGSKNNDKFTGSWSKYTPTNYDPVVFNVTVPAGTPNCYIIGDWDGWSQFTEMTKVDDTHYTVTIYDVCKKTLKYKYCYGPSWGCEEVSSTDLPTTTIDDRTHKSQDEVKAWIKYRLVGDDNIGWSWKNDYSFDIAGDMSHNFDAKNYNIKVMSSTEKYYTHNEHTYNLHRSHTSVKIPHEGGENNQLILQADLTGTYKFHFDPVSKLLTIEFPEKGYRLKITMEDGTVYTSNAVDNATETLSFFAPGSDDTELNGTIILEHIGNKTADIPYTSFKTSGVYTAKLNSNNTGITDIEPYDGNYYIRTDGANGGWSNYKTDSDNEMTYFVPREEEKYSYYWVAALPRADRNESNGVVNAKACVANEYNDNLAVMLGGDKFTSDSDGNVKIIDPDEHHREKINVRFGYNPKTNHFERAMLTGSGNINTFLNIFDPLPEGHIWKTNNNGTLETQLTAAGKDNKFTDISNWVYERDIWVDVQYDEDVTVCLTAVSYNGARNSLFGFNDAEQTTPTQRIIAAKGSTPAKKKMRVIYDFKTNRMIMAWMPGEYNCTEDEILHSDVLFLRHENDLVPQLTIEQDKHIKGIQSQFFALEFENRGDANYEEHYWITLPFDCVVGSISGVPGYMQIWGIQRYRGDLRAQKGWFKETDTFWEWMKPDDVMEAGVGYVLTFDKKAATWNTFDVHTENADGTITTTQRSLLRLYFPSTTKGFTFESHATFEKEYADEPCTIKTDNRYLQDGNWKVIGSLSYNSATAKPDIKTGDNVWKPEEDGDHVDVSDKWSAPMFRYKFQYDNSTVANSKKWKYIPEDGEKSNYQAFYGYMVQFAGLIKWSEVSQSIHPRLRARTYTDQVPTNITTQLELVDADGNQQDQTFVSLDIEGTTTFDLNKDLNKVFNSNFANLYTLSEDIPFAGNTLPMEKAIVPVGVRIATAGEYTFRMPDGTDGISVTLIDNQTSTHTDMLMSEYTVTLDVGTIENRFYLVVDPDRTATSVENIGEEAKGEEAKGQIKKFLIDGKLFIRTADGIFDAKGQRL